MAVPGGGVNGRWHATGQVAQGDCVAIEASVSAPRRRPAQSRRTDRPRSRLTSSPTCRPAEMIAAMTRGLADPSRNASQAPRTSRNGPAAIRRKIPSMSSGVAGLALHGKRQPSLRNDVVDTRQQARDREADGRSKHHRPKILHARQPILPSRWARVRKHGANSGQLQSNPWQFFKFSLTCSPADAALGDCADLCKHRRPEHGRQAGSRSISRMAMSKL